MKIRHCLLAVLLVLPLGFMSLAVSAKSLQASNKAKVVIKLQSAYPKHTKYLGELPYQLAKLVHKMSNGRIEIKVYQPNSLVHTLLLEKSVGAAKLDAAFSGLGYVAHEAPVMELFTAVPFGPVAGAYSGWMYNGGGLQLLDKYLARENVVAMPGLLLPTEASGWFNKEIKTPKDLRGLKIRAYGLARPILRRLGAQPVMMAGHELYGALKRGEIAAAEYSLPSVDRDLKLYQVAKYYYLPGWHQPATFIFVYFNKSVWQKLSVQDRTIIRVACRYLVCRNYGKMEAAQKNAINELRLKTIVRVWSPNMLRLFYNTWQQLVKEYSQQDPRFNEVWQSLKQYQKTYNYWGNMNRSLLVQAG